jgi:hypothetical protein
MIPERYKAGLFPLVLAAIALALVLAPPMSVDVAGRKARGLAVIKMGLDWYVAPIGKGPVVALIIAAGLFGALLCWPSKS